MKKSKRVIEEIFSEKEFAEFMSAYFDGDFDPYRPDHWILDAWWLTFYRFEMSRFGAQEMRKLDNNKISFAINITQKDDEEFKALSVRKSKVGLLLWLLDTIGFKDYEEIKDFDPYNYDIFSELLTRKN